MRLTSTAVFLILSFFSTHAASFAIPQKANDIFVRRQAPYSVVNVGGDNFNGAVTTLVETVTVPNVPQAPVTVTVTETPSSTPALSTSISSIFISSTPISSTPISSTPALSTTTSSTLAIATSSRIAPASSSYFPSSRSAAAWPTPSPGDRNAVYARRSPLRN